MATQKYIGIRCTCCKLMVMEKVELVEVLPDEMYVCEHCIRAHQSQSTFEEMCQGEAV